LESRHQKPHGRIHDGSFFSIWAGGCVVSAMRLANRDARKRIQRIMTAFNTSNAEQFESL